MSRIDLYLNQAPVKPYCNTERENELVDKFETLYTMALSAHDSNERCSPQNIEKWRKAYEGTLNALKQDGTESQRKSRQLRKFVYEIVESKIDNSIPMPKIVPRYKTDLPLVAITENYLKFEVDRIMTRYDNDRAERSTYIDGTGWYKVWWDSLDNTHERSGNVKIDFLTVDQVIPQPGVLDYRQLEYVFEREMVSTSRIYDMYGRLMTVSDGNSNMVEVVSCYYLNENRIVGLFMWCPTTMQVICHEKDWQIRKLRKCTTCGTINPTSQYCGFCGGTRFKYENATTEILDEDIMMIYNPYDNGETDDPQQNKYEARVFLEKGTEIPFYQLRQLPFVPRPAISSTESIYGISEVKIILEMQDGINKVLTKAIEKTLKSGEIGRAHV